MPDEKRDPDRPADDAGEPDPSRVTAAWYQGLPLWSRLFLQLGFAGVVGILFVWASREQAGQLRQFQDDARSQAKADRQMFREELKLLRDAHEKRAQATADALHQVAVTMARAVDALDRTSRAVGGAMKKDDDPDRDPGPKGDDPGGAVRVAPPPKTKDDPPTGGGR